MPIIRGISEEGVNLEEPVAESDSAPAKSPKSKMKLSKFWVKKTTILWGVKILLERRQIALAERHKCWRSKSKESGI
jgi:hypothetical protein